MLNNKLKTSIKNKLPITINLIIESFTWNFEEENFRKIVWESGHRGAKKNCGLLHRNGEECASWSGSADRGSSSCWWGGWKSVRSGSVGDKEGFRCLFLHKLMIVFIYVVILTWWFNIDLNGKRCKQKISLPKQFDSWIIKINQIINTWN